MAANRSLVGSLKRSAAIRRDRLLCCLVALLEGKHAFILVIVVQALSEILLKFNVVTFSLE